MLCEEDDWQHLRLSHAKLLTSLFNGTLFAYCLCFLNDILICQELISNTTKDIIRVPISHQSYNFHNYCEMHEKNDITHT